MQIAQQSTTIRNMIIASAIILALSLGIRHAFALYLEPMSHHFGWGHQVFSLAIASQNLIWGLAQPFTGALADRYGSRIVVAIGGLLYMIGLAIMAVSSTGILLNLSLGLILGIALSATSFSVLLSAIGRMVVAEKRSMAMGIASAAGSFGQFIMLPSTLMLIQYFGWSAALLVSAVLVALILPLSFWIRSPVIGKQKAFANKADLTLKQILNIARHHRPFWWLSLGFLVCGFQVVFLGIHLPGYLIDHGYDAKTGTIFLALVGLFNVIGTYGAGWLGDRYCKARLLTYLYGLRGVAMILFLLLPLSVYSVYAFGIVMGLLWLSTVPLTNGLVANMFGVKYLSMLSGMVFLTHQIGSFLGGYLGGLNHDLTGDYYYVWLFSILLSGFGVVIHFFVSDHSALPKQE
ncbi:MFS transporter [Acinetobacter qingfengensis]|uniref:MFS transporter n=1 Tax=Acinetobacter qingfengensis TaxID=1262585 RepID=A0A1E7QXP4_9GAMM|nr:MFS transporter [Acinetobacter qingfengensis]OEY91776.1 MFS transporter [Acinetobacter qingfengensis]